MSISGQTEFSLWRLDRYSYQWLIRDSALRRRYKHDRFLRAAPILRLLSNNEIWRLNDIAIELRLREGQVVLQEGSLNAAVVIVMNGQLEQQIQIGED